MVAMAALAAAACVPANDGAAVPVTAPTVGTCIERPGADVLDRARDDQPAEFQVRPVACDQRPNLRVTELLPASTAYNVGDPFTSRAGGPSCDPPAQHWALVTPPGGRQVVLCLADQS
jgi:hypothetical protein